jgi:glycosyltransferase involved in cell wall biosynthesis
MKKRILIFSTSYYPFVGGSDIAVREITNRLSGDFEFDLIMARLDKKLPVFEKSGAVNIYRLGFGYQLLDKLLVPFWGAYVTAWLQKKHEYICFWGIMVTFATGAGYIYNIWRRLMGQKKIPMILTLQEGDSDKYLTYKWGGLLDLSWRLSLWGTDILTGISTFLLDRARKKGYKGMSVLVPNGVDVELFTKEIDENLRDTLKTRLDKKEGDIFLVTTSRLTHKNANDDVISALTQLPENIHFIIIGKGELGPKLQRQAKALGVYNRVKFLGLLLYKEIPAYLSICDIFIRPSRSEGFGNSFIEAMAAGLPVIATPVGGILDFIDDKETGVFCSPDNPKSISEAVRFLLDNPDLREHIVKNAKARVIERYDWNHIAQKMKTNVFEKVA